MLGRGRREERREERHDGPAGPVGGAGGGANRYQMTQRMVSIGDDFWIENERGEKVYKVDGKALRVRQTLIFEDRGGKELCKIQERMLRVKDSMEIEDADGRQVAMVKKALITPVRERWTVNLRGGPDLEIQGNILDHEYKIEHGRQRIAEISKKWFRLRDSYGVEIDPGQDDVLILAATVAVDMMAHPER
ncbi:LURP-one-related family protein [Caldilinea sp.]|uniref:LURP-one-related/scramblase family protein n=1 Tax=Caldilinea sp. TaxID=2293560 RepID=UPI002B8C7965|nr:LURP-one-related family protein [Caldilinea sp.]HRA68335.1 LURP-one-related family protein [Caldilinea sp.]